jgi:hypothetical protein
MTLAVSRIHKIVHHSEYRENRDLVSKMSRSSGTWWEVGPLSAEKDVSQQHLFVSWPVMSFALQREGEDSGLVGETVCFTWGTAAHLSGMLHSRVDHNCCRVVLIIQIFDFHYTLTFRNSHHRRKK